MATEYRAPAGAKSKPAAPTICAAARNVVRWRCRAREVDDDETDYHRTGGLARRRAAARRPPRPATCQPAEGRMRRLALALLGALTLLAGPARAQTKDVYLLTWGGTIQQMLERDGWDKKFTDATGYHVILVPKATGPEIMATAIAQKDKPQVDVVMSDHLPWLAGLQQGLFAPLDSAAAPNNNNLYAAAKIKDPATGKL